MRHRIAICLFLLAFVCGGKLYAQLWEPLGGGTSMSVQDLYADTSDGKLYIAGQFRYAGDSLFNGLAIWDGLTFSTIGGGLPDASYCLFDSNSICSAPTSVFKFGEEVFLSGAFHTNGGVYPLEYNARWDGSHWNDCGTYDSQLVFDEADDQLFGMGILHDGSAGPMQAFGRWNGSHFEQFGIPLTFSQPGYGPFQAEFFRGEYYFGGNFQEANGLKEIMRWNGSEWRSLQSGILGDANVGGLQVFKDQLFVSGIFYSSQGNAADNLMAWDGNDWYNPFPRIQYISPVYTMRVIDNSLYIRGQFYIDGDTGWEGPYCLAKYDGQNFCAFGGIDIYPWDIVGLNGELYVTGSIGIKLPDTTGAPQGDIINWLGHWIGGDSVDVCISQPVRVQDPQSANEASVSLHPNPTHSQITLTLPPQASAAELQICDLQGRVVRPPQRCRAAEQVDVSALPAGLYFVSLRWRDAHAPGGERVEVLKMVKE